MPQQAVSCFSDDRGPALPWGISEDLCTIVAATTAPPPRLKPSLGGGPTFRVCPSLGTAHHQPGFPFRVLYVFVVSILAELNDSLSFPGVVIITIIGIGQANYKVITLS